MHFLNIDFHFDLSWFIRFLRSLAAASPLRLEMSAIVVCHQADALALPSSLVFCWYLEIHSLVSLWRISCKEKRIINRGSADGLSIFHPVQKFMCVKVVHQNSSSSIQCFTGLVLGNRAAMSRFVAGLLSDHWCSLHIGRWPSM